MNWAINLPSNISIKFCANYLFQLLHVQEYTDVYLKGQFSILKQRISLMPTNSTHLACSSIVCYFSYYFQILERFGSFIMYSIQWFFQISVLLYRSADKSTYWACLQLQIPWESISWNMKVSCSPHVMFQHLSCARILYQLLRTAKWKCRMIEWSWREMWFKEVTLLSDRKLFLLIQSKCFYIIFYWNNAFLNSQKKTSKTWQGMYHIKGLFQPA